MIGMIGLLGYNYQTRPEGRGWHQLPFDVTQLGLCAEFWTEFLWRDFRKLWDDRIIRETRHSCCCIKVQLHLHG